MLMRKPTLFLIYIAINIAMVFLMFAHASFREKAESRFLREEADFLSNLQLTDLCLFTEATYTRHLSQADLHTPFQDSPMSLEHFPSGSLVAPPEGLRK
jgi:hypothetical protein